MDLLAFAVCVAAYHRFFLCLRCSQYSPRKPCPQPPPSFTSEPPPKVMTRNNMALSSQCRPNACSASFASFVATQATNPCALPYLFTPNPLLHSPETNVKMKTKTTKPSGLQKLQTKVPFNQPLRTRPTANQEPPQSSLLRSMHHKNLNYFPINQSINSSRNKQSRKERDASGLLIDESKFAWSLASSIHESHTYTRRTKMCVVCVSVWK